MDKSPCHTPQWARLGRKQTKPQGSSSYRGCEKQGSIVTVWQGLILLRQQRLPHTLLTHRSCSWRRLLLLLTLNGRRRYRGGWRVAQYAHGKWVVRELHRSWTENKQEKSKYLSNTFRNASYLIFRRDWLQQKLTENITDNHECFWTFIKSMRNCQ